MLKPITIQTPQRPNDVESADMVSYKSYDLNNAPIVNLLYEAFLMKYSGNEPLKAFFEWIVAQLQMPLPNPYIYVEDHRIQFEMMVARCTLQDHCPDFIPE